MTAFTSATRLLVLGFQDISTVLLVGTLLGLLFPAGLFPKKTSLTRWPVLFYATMGALGRRLLVQFLGGT